MKLPDKMISDAIKVKFSYLIVTICFKDAISCHSCNSWQLVGSTLLVKIQFIFQEVISREHLLNLPFAAQSDLTAMTIDI